MTNFEEIKKDTEEFIRQIAEKHEKFADLTLIQHSEDFFEVAYHSEVLCICYGRLSDVWSFLKGLSYGLDNN
jgi:hypothetical protein